MPLNSVNTNVGAMVALRQFAAARAEQDVVQRRIATGLRVAGVRDNGAVWSIAQAQRGDVRGLSAIMGSIQRARSAIDVAIASGEVVSGLLLQMREKALAASDPGLDAAAKAALNEEFVQLRDQITRVINDADFDGLNLVDADAEDHEILAGLHEQLRTKTKTKTKKGVTTTTTKTTVGRTTLDLIAEPLNLGGDNVTLAATADLADPAAIPAMLTAVDASIRNVSAALARFGAMARGFGTHQGFLLKMRDGLERSVGDLVDADIGRESARLQALQVRGQLGIEAMSIANGAPGVLLQLFRA